MLSTRSKLSLTQYLSLQDRSSLDLLLGKHGIQAGFSSYYPDTVENIRSIVTAAEKEELLSLLDEIARTQGNLRTNVSPQYVYDERWGDLVSCLLLDGCKVENGQIVPIDPHIEGAEPVEDDLEHELRQSGLAEAEDILRTLNNSAEAFRRSPPDYNGCLSNARVALQALATAIAKQRHQSHSGSFDDTKWGQVLAYLRTSGLITEEEEKGIAGVYGFVSPGAHSPLSLSEQEVARLGRSLAVSMCYFLVRLHNQSESWLPSV